MGSPATPPYKPPVYPGFEYHLAPDPSSTWELPRCTSVTPHGILADLHHKAARRPDCTWYWLGPQSPIWIHYLLCKGVPPLGAVSVLSGRLKLFSIIVMWRFWLKMEGPPQRGVSRDQTVPGQGWYREWRRLHFCFPLSICKNIQGDYLFLQELTKARGGIYQGREGGGG